MKKNLITILICISNWAAYAQEAVTITRENLSTLYWNAQKAERAREYEAAVKIYKSILYIDSTQATPYLKIGNIYAANPNTSEAVTLAIAMYDKYLSLEPNSRNRETIFGKTAELHQLMAEKKASEGWRQEPIDIVAEIRSSPEDIRNTIMETVHPALKAETKEEIEKEIDDVYSLWDKVQIAHKNNELTLSIKYLTEITQQTHPSQPLFAQANAMLADIYASRGDMQKMQEVLEMLEINMKANQEVLQAYNIKLKDAVPFADDVCGIWVSNLSTDKNKLPYVALEIYKEGAEYKAKILPYCTLAKSYKMYRGKAFNYSPKELKSEEYSGYLPYSNAGNIDVEKNKIGFVFGDEKYRRGLNKEVAKGAVDFVGTMGEKVVEGLAHETKLSDIETSMASAGVQMATALIQGLIILATVDKKVTVLYDFNIDRLFTGCADLKLIETRTKRKSTGYEKISTDTIPMRIFKLYSDYNILFASGDNELFGHRQFDNNEVWKMEEYQHVVALKDKSWFNKEAYKALQNKIVDFCWSRATENPYMKEMAFKCKDHIENGMQGLMIRKFTNDNGYFQGWTDFSKKMNGFGICKIYSGEEYVGNWENNTYSGQGKLTYSNGTVYTGSFKNGKRDGYGKYQIGNSYYDGTWVNDKWNGQGILFEDQTFYEGIWKNGELKTGSVEFADGSRYTGSLLKIKDKTTSITKRVPNGKGVMIQSDGATLDGQWKNGEFVSVKAKEEKTNKKSK